MTLKTESNYDTFRDCLSGLVIHRLATPRKPQKRRDTKGRKKAIGYVEAPRDRSPTDNDAEELAKFIEVCMIVLKLCARFAEEIIST